MIHRNHCHGGALGAFAIVAAIGFAFGMPAARFVVGASLVVGALFFLYVLFRVVTGTI